MGCTEPISIAYAGALARKVLSKVPDRVEISVSGNILKNVKSVIVPNTGGLKGIASAVASGIIAGDVDKKLQVLEGVTDNQRREIAEYLNKCSFKVEHSQSGCVFDIGVTVYADNDSAFVRIEGHHTNVVEIKRNGESIECAREECATDCKLTDRKVLNVKDIVEFADTVEIGDIEPLISRQIEYNVAIAREGLSGDYGAGIGKVLLSSFGSGVNNKAKAMAAAGSDARMNGCALPVVIVSGSGNQGMTASVPVVVYAEHLGVSREKTLRAVALADLLTIHLKTGIGRLSAYCGAVSAGAGAGGGISYLYGGGYEEISQTVTNALAITSGLICDGAKSSCAGKIASAVDAGLTGMEMCKNGRCFRGGDGILESAVESTIDNIGDLARIGMKETDEEIIRLMIKNLG